MGKLYFKLVGSIRCNWRRESWVNMIWTRTTSLVIRMGFAYFLAHAFCYNHLFVLLLKQFRYINQVGIYASSIFLRTAFLLSWLKYSLSAFLMGNDAPKARNRVLIRNLASLTMVLEIFNVFTIIRELILYIINCKLLGNKKNL